MREQQSARRISMDCIGGPSTTIRSAVEARPTIYWFRVKAGAEPDMLARVASLFNIANAAPCQAIFLRDSSDVMNMSVAIELSGATMADMIRRKLEQLSCVISVELMGESPI